MLRPFLLLLAAAAIPAQAAFKCIDEKGKSHYEDIPPAACANVTITEVSRSGTVIRKIEPNAPVAAPKKAEPDRAAIDRERRDRTLLDTYANEGEIDRARDRSLDLIKSRKQSAESQLAIVKRRRAQVEANKSAHKGDLEAVSKDQTAIEHAIAGFDTEAQQVRDQSETDKTRWRELSGARKH